MKRIPVTQKLREIEMRYAFPPTDLAALRQARQLITDLWEMHWDGKDNYDYDESSRLLRWAGLTTNIKKQD